MRSSQVVRASGCQYQIRNCPRFGPSILQHSESEGRQMKQCWITHIKRKNRKIPPLKNSVPVSFRFDFFTSFWLFPLALASDFFLVKQFFRNIFVSLRFFASFCLFYVRFRFRFLLWNKRNHAFFSLPNETKFSLHFQFTLPKRERGRTLLRTDFKKLLTNTYGIFVHHSLLLYRIRLCRIFCNVHIPGRWRHSGERLAGTSVWSLNIFKCIVISSSNRGIAFGSFPVYKHINRISENFFHTARKG